MRWLLAAVILACSACRGPAPPQPKPFQLRRPPPVSDLPAQFALRVQVLAVRELADEDPRRTFPAPGFRFEGARLLPCDEPVTTAGTELTLVQLSEWQTALQKTASAGVHLAPSFAISPGRSAVASNVQEVPCLVNWEFDENGVGKKIRSRFNYGTKVQVQTLAIPGSDAVLLKIELDMNLGRLDWFTVADGFSTKKLGSSAPLRLQLPNTAVQRLRTTVPMRPDRSLILAHCIKQYRHAPARATSSAPLVIEHLFYIATLKRIGNWSDFDWPDSSQPPPPRYAMNLLWAQWDDNRLNREKPPGLRKKPAEPAPASFRRISPNAFHAVRARIAKSKRPVFCALGLSAVAGKTVTFELGTESAHVAGIKPPPEPGVLEPHTFDVRSAVSGFTATVRMVPAGDRTTLHLQLRLGDVVKLENLDLILPAIRAPAPGRIMEQYHFTRNLQILGRMNDVLTVSAAELWELRLPWRRDTETDRPETGKDKERVVILKFSKIE